MVLLVLVPIHLSCLINAGHHVQIVVDDACTCTGLLPLLMVFAAVSCTILRLLSLTFLIPLFQFAERSLFFFAIAGAISLLSIDVDLVFATTTPLTAGIPGIFARWLRYSVCFRGTRSMAELPRAMGVVRNPLVLTLLSGLEWLCYHSADHCIGLAPGICDGIAERGVENTRITSIPNACDIELFHPPIFGHAKYPELIPLFPHPLPPDSFVAAFTGAHGLANGLIRSWMLLPRFNAGDATTFICCSLVMVAASLP